MAQRVSGSSPAGLGAGSTCSPLHPPPGLSSRPPHCPASPQLRPRGTQSADESHVAEGRPRGEGRFQTHSRLLAASCASCPNAEVRGGRLVTVRMAEPRAPPRSLVPGASHTAPPAPSLMASIREEMKLHRAQWLWSAAARAGRAESQVPTVEEPSEALEASSLSVLSLAPAPTTRPKPGSDPQSLPGAHPPWVSPRLPGTHTADSANSPEIPYLVPAAHPRWPLPATSAWSQGSPEVTMATTVPSESIDKTTVCKVTCSGRVAGDRGRWN